MRAGTVDFNCMLGRMAEVRSGLDRGLFSRSVTETEPYGPQSGKKYLKLDLTGPYFGPRSSQSNVGYCDGIADRKIQVK